VIPAGIGVEGLFGAIAEKKISSNQRHDLGLKKEG